MALAEISDVGSQGSSDRKLAALGCGLSGREVTGSKNRSADVAMRANIARVKLNEQKAEPFWRAIDDSKFEGARQKWVVACKQNCSW